MAKEWIHIEEQEPPKDDNYFLTCIFKVNSCIPYTPTSAHWGTFHPNAPGKATWRDSSGVKVWFTHWMDLPEKPERRS